jgi:hypothetical protein
VSGVGFAVVALVVFLVSVSGSPPVSAQGLQAARITEDGPGDFGLGGPDRDAGIGDWALSNGTLCAAVSDPSHEGMLYPSGGVLVDLGFCGREDDRWTTMEMMWGFDRRATPVVREVEVGQDAQEAWILTRGERDGVRVETRYSLGRESARRLGISLHLERVGEGPGLASASLVILHPGGQLRPFTLYRADPGRSVGFSYPASDPYSTFSRLRALLPADLQIFVGSQELPGISYGLELVRADLLRVGSDRPEELPTLATTSADASLIGFFSSPFALGSSVPPGLVELAQTPWMDLAPGDRLEVDFRLWVGGRADVASITDQLNPEGEWLRGRVDDPSARLHVYSAQGYPITQVRPDSGGRFAARLEVGRYRIVARHPFRPAVEREVVLDAGGVTLDPIEFGAGAVVTLARQGPRRLTFVGIDGTPDPVFGDDLLGVRTGQSPVPSGWESRTIALADTTGDPDRVTLPPGRYEVYASRGPEFSVERAVVEAVVGREIALRIDPPRRVVETPGWIAADLHVHSDRSFDSSWPMDRQIRALVAEGAEVVVATEHDRVVDPVPVIDALGLSGRLAGMPGVEVTAVAETERIPHTHGHINAFPIAPGPKYRGGAPRGEGRRLREVMADLPPGGSLVQLNHPRTSRRAHKGAFLTHLGVAGEPFDPLRPMDEQPNRVLFERDPETGVRDVDFDLIEGMNGEDFAAYPLVREDWFALLRAGERRTLTANSDSHRAAAVVALPRTYVFVGEDDAAVLEHATFVNALRAGRAFGSTGPVVDVRLGEAGPGETYHGREGDLVVEVRSAPWIPVSGFHVFVDGRRFLSRTIRGPGRFRVPLRFETDTFVTVEVEGPAGPVYEVVAPGFLPFAFTNPIFVVAADAASSRLPG